MEPNPSEARFDVQPKRRRKRVAIQARDVRVMELLVTRRVETLDALHEQGFPGRSRKRAVNRLGELVRAGYLDRRSVELPGSERFESVYFLTSRGRTALQIRSEESSGWFATRHWRLDLNEPSIPHQIMTNRVCDWMGARAIPEHLLPPVPYEPGKKQRPAGSRPDAVFQAREGINGANLVWLEVDLGHYNQKRILEKVKAFSEDRESCYLLLACPTKSREAWLVNVLLKEFGGEIWDRVDIRTFEQLRAGAAPGHDERLRPSDEPPTFFGL